MKKSYNVIINMLHRLALCVGGIKKMFLKLRSNRFAKNEVNNKTWELSEKELFYLIGRKVVEKNLIK